MLTQGAARIRSAALANWDGGEEAVTLIYAIIACVNVGSRDYCHPAGEPYIFASAAVRADPAQN
jgi:hypothetical protein